MLLTATVLRKSLAATVSATVHQTYCLLCFCYSAPKSLAATVSATVPKLTVYSVFATVLRIFLWCLPHDEEHQHLLPNQVNHRLSSSSSTMGNPNLILALTALFLFTSPVLSLEDDVKCLEGLKSSLKDPESRLLSWSFTNGPVGYLCKFIGVFCWNERENRLIGLQLKSMALGGEIPDSLQYCQSLQTLDLSDNKLTGPIPSKICDWLPYLVKIDLSQNEFTGPIPSELVNCKYLNTLVLSDNRLSGPIPYELSWLPRLNKFSVANNGLSGEIPAFLARFDSADFIGNDGLCGKPLGKCSTC